MERSNSNDTHMNRMMTLFELRLSNLTPFVFDRRIVLQDVEWVDDMAKDDDGDVVLFLIILIDIN